MSHRERAGMSMLETMAAISVAGFAILGAVLLLDTATDLSHRILSDGHRALDAGIGAMVLDDLLGHIEGSADSARRFHGDDRGVEFPTRCMTSRGWKQPCSVRLAIDSLGDSSTVVATLPEGEATLARFPRLAAFRYIDLTRGESAWTARWNASSNPPGSLAILSAEETLYFRVGRAR